jgi:hypothetical protein
MSLLAGAVVALACSAEAPASAQSIIKNPGDHPNYRVELEPHLNFGWAHYRGSGLGVGARASIVVVDNGFVSSINNSVAISFGLDWLRYGDCYYYDYRYGSRGYGCGASYFMFPVAMQWNFWLSPKWSVFGEPGLHIYHGVWDDWCDPNLPGCSAPTRTGVDFAFWAGGRFHFSETVALTMRIGYPTFSIGVSFLF